MILDYIISALSLSFCLLAAHFYWLTVKHANAIKLETEAILKIKTRLDYLETDFSEKFDHFVRKSASREAMRKKREPEPEDSSTENVLVPV